MNTKLLISHSQALKAMIDQKYQEAMEKAKDSEDVHQPHS